MKLLDCFDKYKCDKGSLKHRYDRVYEPALEKIKNSSFTMLEVGVFAGASLGAWLEYFPNANFVGIDLFKRVPIQNVPVFNHPKVTLIKQNSTQPLSQEFLNKFEKGLSFDIIIDDGSHTHESQLKTFVNLIDYLKPGGQYFIEDVWPFSIMTQEEKNHQWIISHPKEFSDEKYDRLLNVVNNYCSKVIFHDLRKNYGPDTFIIEVQK